MATVTLTHIPYNAHVGDSWENQNQVNFGWCVDSGDGVAYNFVSKIEFKPTTNIDVMNLRLRLTLNGDSKPYKCAAYLSTSNLTTREIQSSASTAALSSCTAKRLVNGALQEYPSGWSSNYGNPDVYFEFELNSTLEANKTYYIYLYGANASSSNNLKVYGRPGDSTRTLTAITPDIYTVTYDANGGSGSMSDSTVAYGEYFITRKNEFIRHGYTFNGWNEKADGTGEKWTLTSAGVYEHGVSWKWTYTKNITLYAQWVESKHPVNAVINDVTKECLSFVHIDGVYKEGIAYVKTPRGYKTL